MLIIVIIIVLIYLFGGRSRELHRHPIHVTRQPIIANPDYIEVVPKTDYAPSPTPAPDTTFNQAQAIDTPQLQQPSYVDQNFIQSIEQVHVQPKIQIRTQTHEQPRRINKTRVKKSVSFADSVKCQLYNYDGFYMSPVFIGYNI